jgi:hypothetical protein
MKRILTLTFILMLPVAGVFSQATKGLIKLVDESMEDSAPVLNGKSGAVEYKMKLVHGDFFGAATITPHPEVTNTSDKKVRFSITLALFDGKGFLVGAVAQNSDLDPKENANFGSFIIHVPDFDTWKSVASYQIVTFSSDVQK